MDNREKNSKEGSVLAYFVKDERTEEEKVIVTNDRNVLLENKRQALYSLPSGNNAFLGRYIPIKLSPGLRIIISPSPDVDDCVINPSAIYIVQEVKRIPASIYREVVIPELKARADKYNSAVGVAAQTRSEAIKAAYEAEHDALRKIGEVPNLGTVVKELQSSLEDKIG